MSMQVPDIPTSEEQPKHKGLSWWLENSLSRVFKRFVNQSKDTINALLAKVFETTTHNLENAIIPFIRPFANIIIDSPGIPDSIKQPIKDSLSGQSQGGIAIIAAVVWALGETVKMGVSGPMGRKMSAQVDRKVRSYLFGPEICIELWKRNIISETKCNDLLAYNGISDSAIVAMKQLKTPILDDSTLTNLWWRKDISSDLLRIELRKKGMNDAQISLWIQLRQVIPSPGELVSIAVREGFNDSIAAQFGYDENYPTEAAEWAEKGGMQQQFFRALWRAHWNLPGLVQVREMYHRGIVGDNELDTYLLAADYPVYWRNSIKEWMFSTVTRVDARRMYDLGIWSIERVKRHNLELGYNEADATDMTIWIAMSYAEKERELTKTDILSMYKDGILNYNESIQMLTSLDFNPASMSLMLTHQDLKRDEEYERAIIRNVKDLFIGGMYNRQDVLIELAKINTPPDVIRQSLAVWDLEKERKIVRPTVAQLRDMAQEGVITVNEWRNEMSNRRYGEKYIDWYQRLWLEE